MKAQTPSSINTRTLEQELADARKTLAAWASIKPNEPFSWQPPIPIVITGVVFSEPVLIEQVVFGIDFLISPPYGQKRVAVPAIYFPQHLFTPNQDLRVTLSEPSSASATLEFSDEALVGWITREHSAK